jgi:hypothetical protein
MRPLYGEFGIKPPSSSPGTIREVLEPLLKPLERLP